MLYRDHGGRAKPGPRGEESKRKVGNTAPTVSDLDELVEEMQTPSALSHLDKNTNCGGINGLHDHGLSFVSFPHW